MSGALDRLHYEKDPCVRYDGSRKVWIYLHRGRNEEDFGEWLHIHTSCVHCVNVEKCTCTYRCHTTISEINNYSANSMEQLLFVCFHREDILGL